MVREDEGCHKTKDHSEIEMNYQKVVQSRHIKQAEVLLFSVDSQMIFSTVDELSKGLLSRLPKTIAEGPCHYCRRSLSQLSKVLVTVVEAPCNNCRRLLSQLSKVFVTISEGCIMKLPPVDAGTVLQA